MLCPMPARTSGIEDPQIHFTQPFIPSAARNRSSFQDYVAKNPTRAVCQVGC